MSLSGVSRCLNFNGTIKRRWSRGRYEKVNQNSSSPDGSWVRGGPVLLFPTGPNFRRFGLLSLTHDLDLAGPLSVPKRMRRAVTARTTTHTTIIPTASPRGRNGKKGKKGIRRRQGLVGPRGHTGIPIRSGIKASRGLAISFYCIDISTTRVPANGQGISRESRGNRTGIQMEMRRRFRAICGAWSVLPYKYLWTLGQQ